jgi:hypothetical protein|tara:strand:+ start:21921 stop:22418 length:498 start_codon:yes stop_codon:yes gene_type:complete
LEDPNPQIQKGSGITRAPDLVVAGRFQPYEHVHTKLALIIREIRGQNRSGDVSNEFAWGVPLSGSVSTPQLERRDKVLFHVNHSNGIGRYINDLSSIGNYDGIFVPDTGELQLFNGTAGIYPGNIGSPSTNCALTSPLERRGPITPDSSMTTASHTSGRCASHPT